MEEESLLPESEATTTEATTETTTETTEEVTPWYTSEGITGEGDKPDWLNNAKYKSVEDQAKAYPELASKFGGFTGAPDDYEMSMPDGIDGEIATDDPLVGEFQQWAKDNNLNQDGFTNILHMFIKNEYEVTGTNMESELNAIGDNAKERLQNVSNFGAANLSEEGFEGLKGMLTTASGMKAVEELIGLTRSPKLPDNSETVTGITHSELKERMRDPLYQSDPDFRKETSLMYERKFGKEPKQTTIG